MVVSFICWIVGKLEKSLSVREYQLVAVYVRCIILSETEHMPLFTFALLL